MVQHPSQQFFCHVEMEPEIPGISQFYGELNVSCSQTHRVVRKTDFSVGENKRADQLGCNCEADQRICFCYMDSTIPLLYISKNSSL